MDDGKKSLELEVEVFVVIIAPVTEEYPRG